MTKETELVLEKLKTYKGSLTATKWNIPKTSRQFSCTLNRVIKLYHSVINRQLYYPELIEQIKEIAVYFKIYTLVHRPDKIDYLCTLNEIIEFEPPMTFVTIEETRVRQECGCSVCGVPLVYPGYLIYITNEGTRVSSKPTGIHCLHSLHGKLDEFKTTLKVFWDIDGMVKQIELEGSENI